MSKSLGNFYTLRDLLQKGYTGREVRYLLLSTHYRTQLNFTMQGLDAARSSLQRFEDLILRLRGITQKEGNGEEVLATADKRFREALSEDLNISAALAALFDLVRELNSLADEKRLSHKAAQEALAHFESWDKVLGVIPLKSEEEAPAELLALLERREKARRERDFRLSDEMRDEIHQKGYLIEDTPQGARLKKR